MDEDTKNLISELLSRISVVEGLVSDIQDPTTMPQEFSNAMGKRLGISGSSSSSSSSVSGSSYGTANTAIASGSFTKVQVSTNRFANGITWDGANNKFVITEAGDYLLTGQATFTNIAGATQYLLEIRVNGVEVVQVSHGGSASWDLGITGTDTIALSVGDYVELYVRQNSGVSQNISNSNVTHLSLMKI